MKKKTTKGGMRHLKINILENDLKKKNNGTQKENH